MRHRPTAPLQRVTHRGNFSDLTKPVVIKILHEQEPGSEVQKDLSTRGLKPVFWPDPGAPGTATARCGARDGCSKVAARLPHTILPLGPTESPASPARTPRRKYL